MLSNSINCGIYFKTSTLTFWMLHDLEHIKCEFFPSYSDSEFTFGHTNHEIGCVHELSSQYQWDIQVFPNVHYNKVNEQREFAHI